MAHDKSDPAHNAQFRRHWTGRRPCVKFFAEMTKEEAERLALEYGERVVAGLPHAALVRIVTERQRDLVLSLGEQRLQRLQQQRERERERAAQTLPPRR